MALVAFPKMGVGFQDTQSAQSSATYTIAVATPELSHTSGAYAAGQVVTITTATAGATLRYTLNGQNPTATDPVVPSGGLVVGNFTPESERLEDGLHNQRRGHRDLHSHGDAHGAHGGGRRFAFAGDTR